MPGKAGPIARSPLGVTVGFNPVESISAAGPAAAGDEGDARGAFDPGVRKEPVENTRQVVADHLAAVNVAGLLTVLEGDAQVHETAGGLGRTEYRVTALPQFGGCLCHNRVRAK